MRRSRALGVVCALLLAGQALGAVPSVVAAASCCCDHAEGDEAPGAHRCHCPDCAQHRATEQGHDSMGGCSGGTEVPAPTASPVVLLPVVSVTLASPARAPLGVRPAAPPPFLVREVPTPPPLG